MPPGKRKAKKTTKKKAKRKIQAYVFIDTNIFLDFYRASEATLSMLEKLESVRDRIICTYQVEMEFLKNRQREITKIANAVDLVLDAKLPAVLSDTQLDSYVTTTGRTLKGKRTRLKKNLINLLRYPKRDRVLTVLKQIFQSDSGHVLTRDMTEEKAMIKRLATRRFQLGYPPRKRDDTSMGDAFNWEWIVHCASQLRGRVIVVSKDSDYGQVYEKECFLNDQLKQEFRKRVGGKSIVYTQKLSEALRLLAVHVTKKETDSEAAEVVRLGELDTIRQLHDEFAAQQAAIQHSFVHPGANFALFAQAEKVARIIQSSQKDIARLDRKLRILYK